METKQDTVTNRNKTTNLKNETEEETMNENKGNIKVLTEDDVVKLSNALKRRDFIANYREWGVWLNIAQLGVSIYKVQLPNGDIIYITEFPERQGYCVPYYPKAFRYAGSDGLYDSYSDSESVIIERLKDLKTQILTKRRQSNEKH